MDPFRALTGGGMRFDTRRFGADMQPFEGKKKKLVRRETEKGMDELDFFGTAPSGTGTGTGTGTGMGTNEDGAAGGTRGKKRKRVSAAAQEGSAPPSDAQHIADLPAFLRTHRIKLTGLDPPAPLPSVPASVAAAWARSSRGTGDDVRRPTPVQMASWGVMLAGRDLLACAPTGSGKTLAFLIPVLALAPPRPTTTTSTTTTGDGVEGRSGPRVVILEPTRELAMQVLRECRTLVGEAGKATVGVLGDLGGNKKKKKERQKGQKGKGKEKENEAEMDEVVDPSSLDILITTPLRLVFALQSSLLSLASVEHLILDEADKLFERNFVLQTDAILAACTHPALRKAMFSATLPSAVEELARGVMTGGEVRAIVGHKDSANTSIDQTLTFVHHEDHKLATLRSLIHTGQFTPPVLVFVQSIPRAKELAHALVLDGLSADCIHADRSGDERDDVVRRFAEGKVWVLVCTDVLGRGVDFKGVKLVVNYDFPQSAGSYIHRIGRTGRAGKSGKAITFFTKSDAPYLRLIVNVMRASGCPVEPWMLDLKNPTQDQKKALQMKPLGRKDVGGLPKRDKVAGRRKKVRVMGGEGKPKKDKVALDE